MSKFSKSSACPLSNDLLAFQSGRLAARELEKITVHLRFCEFCAAEVEFYSHYPQTEESVEKAEMPPALRELAEALLNRGHNDLNLLKNMLFERKGSTTAGW